MFAAPICIVWNVLKKDKNRWSSEIPQTISTSAETENTAAKKINTNINTNVNNKIWQNNRPIKYLRKKTHNFSQFHIYFVRCCAQTTNKINMKLRKMTTKSMKKKKTHMKRRQNRADLSNCVEYCAEMSGVSQCRCAHRLHIFSSIC